MNIKKVDLSVASNQALQTEKSNLLRPLETEPVQSNRRTGQSSKATNSTVPFQEAEIL